VLLWRAGNDHEADKSDNTRHTTHSKSNKHADDNLLHDILVLACDPPKARAASLICVILISTFLQHKTLLAAILFQACRSQLTPESGGSGNDSSRSKSTQSGTQEKDSIRDSARTYSVRKKLLMLWRGNGMDRYQFVNGRSVGCD
jgi:hypothetical protein